MNQHPRIEFGLYRGYPAAAWTYGFPVWLSAVMSSRDTINERDVNKNVVTRRPIPGDDDYKEAVFWQERPGYPPSFRFSRYVATIDPTLYVSEDGRVWRNCVIVEKSS